MNNNQNPWYGINPQYLSELALCPSIRLAGCSNTMENFKTCGGNSGNKTKKEMYDHGDIQEGEECLIGHYNYGLRRTCGEGLYCTQPEYDSYGEIHKPGTCQRLGVLGEACVPTNGENWIENGCRRGLYCAESGSKENTCQPNK